MGFFFVLLFSFLCDFPWYKQNIKQWYSKNDNYVTDVCEKTSEHNIWQSLCAIKNITFRGKHFSPALSKQWRSLLLWNADETVALQKFIYLFILIFLSLN